jgi:hypothetical protein
LLLPKKGGKAARNKKGNDPYANTTCNHCPKKGHVEVACWKKHLNKIPEKVKAARKRKEEKKTSTAAAAIESKEKDIILGAIECSKSIFEPLDIAEGYRGISREEENYVYFSDDEDSLEDEDKGNSNENIKIEKKNETFQNATVQEEENMRCINCVTNNAIAAVGGPVDC